jgi:single-strand DNA-binding protein
MLSQRPSGGYRRGTTSTLRCRARTPTAPRPLAVTARVKDGDSWRDGDTSFYRITAWRGLAEHIGDSLAKGHRVIVVGQLRARSWETPEGERRTVVEVQAEEVGPSLRWATAKPERATGNGKGGQFNDDPPF